MTTQHIPIFPLKTVLFPGGNLPLRIFEPRYLDMVSACLKNESGFGICLIKNGDEIGSAAAIHHTGTLCEISYFNTQADGLLGITATGKQRFKILSTEIQANQLTTAKIDLLENEHTTPISADFEMEVKLLKQLFEQLGQPYKKMDKHYQCASWVSCRLTELLPFDLLKKQQFLEMNDPLARTAQLHEVIVSMSISKKSIAPW